LQLYGYRSAAFKKTALSNHDSQFGLEQVYGQT
jgi:hypothetical protein